MFRRTLLMALAAAGVFGLAVSPVRAAPDLTPWFASATAYHDATPAQRMAAPDFLRGTWMRSMASRDGVTSALIQSGIWELQKYDRVHQFALASATTDQCSIALFRAAPPPEQVTLVLVKERVTPITISESLGSLD